MGGGIYDAMLAHCALKARGGNDLYLERPPLSAMWTGGNPAFTNTLTAVAVSNGICSDPVWHPL